MNATFGLCGKLVAQEGKRDELAEVLLEAAGAFEENERCVAYVVSTIDEEPEAVWVTELWSDAGAHADSLQDGRVLALIAKGRPLIARMEGQVRFRPLGGKVSVPA